MSFNLLQPIAAASTTVAGFVALATSGAVAAGSDNTTVLTPLGAKAVYAGVASGNRFTKAQEIVVSGLPTLLNISGGVNGYTEINIKNISNGASASSDITVTANNGTASSQYANFGINGSGYAGAWGGSGDAYVYSNDSHLWMGTSAAAKNIILSVGNAGVSAGVTIGATGITLGLPLTGTPLTPTATPLTSSKQIANTEYVDFADLSATAALVEREGLRFDGTAQVPVSNSAGTALGSSDFTDIFEINCDSFGPTAQRISQRANTRGDIVIDPTGPLLFTSAIDSVQITGPAPTAGVPQIGVVVRSSAGVKISIDGGSTFTAPVANSTVMGALTGFGLDVFGSTTFLKAKLSRYISFNYALTASEIAALQRRGLVTLPEQRGGSMVALNTSAFAIDPANPVSVPLYGTFTGSSSSGFTAASVTGDNRGCASTTFAVRAGQKFLATFTATLTSGQAPDIKITRTGTADYSNIQTVVNGANSVVLTCTGNQSAAFVRFTNSANTSYSISGFSIIPLGTLFEQDSGQRGAGYCIRDTSGNNAHLQLPASGVSIINPAQEGEIIGNGLSSGYLYGNYSLLPTGFEVSEIWVKTSVSGATFSIGSSSSVTDVISPTVSSTTSWQKVVNPNTPSTGIFYISISTGTLSVKVKIEKVT